MTINPGLKALLWWGLFLTLTLLNPTPTGGATIMAAPVGVFTIYATKEYLNDRAYRRDRALEAHQEAA